MMGIMFLSKNTAFVSVVILCTFVFFVGATAAKDRSRAKMAPLNLESDTENKTECYCGPHGDCKLEKDGNKECFCEIGYQENNGVCEVCDCGENGICFFNQSVKTCHCLPEYGDKDGICSECSCSLLFPDGSKERIRCSFENGVEKCKCPKGYKVENTTCVDIDECQIPSSCPNTTICMNLPGDFICLCEAGYIDIKGDPRRYGCQDANECEYDGCPHNESTSCVNTQGSFYCECKPGYSRKYGSKHVIKALGCEKDGLGTGYIILITVIAAIVVVGVASMIKKLCFSHTRNPRYRTGI